MKRIAVVDMDDTLAMPRKLTHYLWTLARFIFNLGRLLQKRNDALFEKLKGYDTVIVLTARTEKHRRITEHQLRKWGIQHADIIFCPVNHVMFGWKQTELERIEFFQRLAHGDVKIEWFDNLKYVLGAEG